MDNLTFFLEYRNRPIFPVLPRCFLFYVLILFIFMIIDWKIVTFIDLNVMIQNEKDKYILSMKDTKEILLLSKVACQAFQFLWCNNSKILVVPQFTINVNF